MAEIHKIGLKFWYSQWWWFIRLLLLRRRPHLASIGCRVCLLCISQVLQRHLWDIHTSFKSLHSCQFNPLTLNLLVFSIRTKPLKIRSLPPCHSLLHVEASRWFSLLMDVVVEVYDSTQPSSGLYSTEFTEKPVWSLLCGLVQLQKPNQSVSRGGRYRSVEVSRRISWLKPKFWLF